MIMIMIIIYNAGSQWRRYEAVGSRSWLTGGLNFVLFYLRERSTLKSARSALSPSIRRDETPIITKN